jgi:hypothetical protein
MEKNRKCVSIPEQAGLFEFLEEKSKALPEGTVKIEGVINIKTFSDFTVRSTYRDIFLIINMLDDYVAVLKDSGEEINQCTKYMISQFERISNELAEQIELDKEKMYRKCQNKMRDDTGKDAMILAAGAGKPKPGVG